MNIQISGYSIVRFKDNPQQIRFVVVQGINLDRKCYGGEGYEMVYVRRMNNTQPGLIVPARYANIFTKEVIGKKAHCNFNVNGNVDEFELLK